MKCAFILYGILLIVTYNSALEYNKQRLNANTDFLLHEGGVQTNVPNSNINGAKRDYVAEFPSLGSPVTPKSTSTTAFNNNFKPHNNPKSSNGKRDYVAPQLPTQKSGQTTTATTAWTKGSTSVQDRPQTSNGKRDYVAPNFPPLKQPDQSNGGNVKDLINFYENKGPNQGTPSFSSILQGSANKNGQISTTKISQPSPTTSPFQTTKPMSFSSVVAGQNKPLPSHGAQTHTPAKPLTHASSTHGVRQGTTSLPSSIANNNRVTNTNNNNGNSVTDAELQILSEELLRKDSNNAARYITVNYQDKTTSQSREDRAPRPLITVSPEVWNIPTIQKFVPLLDNYERDAFVNEHVTPQERIEENDFMDAVMSTTVMRHLMTFFKNKAYVSPDPKQQRDFVKQLWFTLYSRGKGRLGSSGFEHSFVSELKNGAVSGLHNWIYFSREEAANRANYLGYLKYVEISDKGAVLKFHFNQQGVDKPVNSMFIGTSPELELALYTLCYVTRVENDCNLKLGNKDVNIVTYNYRYRSKNLIGSAYPQI